MSAFSRFAVPLSRLATFYLFAPILPYLKMFRSFFVDPVGGTVGDHLRIDTFLNDLYNGSTSKTSNAITQKTQTKNWCHFSERAVVYAHCLYRVRSF